MTGQNSDKRESPPAWPTWLLRKLCAEEHLDVLMGDLEELYEYRRTTRGKWSARWHYVKDAFDLLRPFALKKKKSKLKNNTVAMFKNYFKISFRNMLRHKVYSSINIAGLSIGIACFILIFLYVQDELSYDKHIPDSERVYRIACHIKYADNLFNMPSSPDPMAKTLP